MRLNSVLCCLDLTGCMQHAVHASGCTSWCTCALLSHGYFATFAAPTARKKKPGGLGKGVDTAVCICIGLEGWQALLKLQCTWNCCSSCNVCQAQLKLQCTWNCCSWLAIALPVRLAVHAGMGKCLLCLVAGACQVRKEQAAPSML
jgi:hypothetical protein